MGAELDQAGRTIFEKSVAGRRSSVLPPLDVPKTELPVHLLRKSVLHLPEVSEPDLMRHFLGLTRRNFSIGSGMYPLGSCTMKYNPRRHEAVVAMEGFADIHPAQPVDTIQGWLEALYHLQGFLAEISGLRAVSLAPMAGAHGEYAGIAMVRAFHRNNGEDDQRRKVLIPDSAHGTNPATAAMAGYEVVQVRSNSKGDVDQAHLNSLLGENVAAMMLTYPSTLGLPDGGILEIAAKLHGVGALLYGDGANMNALLGIVRPGELGVDVIHMNTHKSAATPHGGGGPGAGPVMASEALAQFLPDPVIHWDANYARYDFFRPEKSIGRLGTWYGNTAVLLRAYAYILSLGSKGLRAVSENAVLNANYVKVLLQDVFNIKYGRERSCMHEVVIDGTRQKPAGVSTMDIAKRLIDLGFHPPTVYFPLIVDGAMMVEPTETESKETLDAFVAAMRAIAREAEETPELLHSAPHYTPVGRLDEAQAARKPVLRWRPPEA